MRVGITSGERKEKGSERYDGVYLFNTCRNKGVENTKKGDCRTS